MQNEREKLKFDLMLEDHKKGLYPNCEDDNRKLGTTLELLQWKADNCVSEKGFFFATENNEEEQQAHGHQEDYSHEQEHREPARQDGPSDCSG